MTRTAPSGLELLLTEECYGVIGGNGVGTVDLTRHALSAPVDLPYIVEGPDVLLDTGQHQGLQDALDGVVAILQVDVTDAARTSWRVVLVGPAAREGLLVRIRPTDVTGYRLPTSRA